VVCLARRIKFQLTFWNKTRLISYPKLRQQNQVLPPIVPLGPIHPLGHLSRATIIRGGGSSREPSLKFPAAAVIAIECAVSQQISRQGGGRGGGIAVLLPLPSSLSTPLGAGGAPRAIDFPCRHWHHCRVCSLSMTIKTRGGERGGNCRSATAANDDRLANARTDDSIWPRTRELAGNDERYSSPGNMFPWKRKPVSRKHVSVSKHRVFCFHCFIGGGAPHA
jgi:hypothetical protein